MPIIYVCCFSALFFVFHEKEEKRKKKSFPFSLRTEINFPSTVYARCRLPRVRRGRAGKKGLKGKRKMDKKKHVEREILLHVPFLTLDGWENKMRYFCELYEMCIVRHYTKDTHPHTHYMYIKKSISPPPPPPAHGSCENSKTKQHTSSSEKERVSEKLQSKCRW